MLPREKFLHTCSPVLLTEFFRRSTIIISVYDADAIRVLEDGDLETLGRFDYGARLDHPFTAHPKVDPITGWSIFSS